MVTYAKISHKHTHTHTHTHTHIQMVNPRDIAGNAKEDLMEMLSCACAPFVTVWSCHLTLCPPLINILHMNKSVLTQGNVLTYIHMLYAWSCSHTYRYAYLCLHTHMLYIFFVELDSAWGFLPLYAHKCSDKWLVCVKYYSFDLGKQIESEKKFSSQNRKHQICASNQSKSCFLFNALPLWSSL